jgi:chaperonin GroEL
VKHHHSLALPGAKELYFNHNGEALKRMQTGVDKLAAVVGVTLGPRGRNVVLETKFGCPKIVNDGVTVAKEVDLHDPVECIGAKLVQQAASKTNDSAGDGTTTAIILSAALITEGMKMIAAGSNPIQIVRGIEKSVQHTTRALANYSIAIRSDEDLLNIATVSAGDNKQIGMLISDALAKVGRQGVVTLQESKTANDVLSVVEGMQFERGYISPYFVTDPERMICEYEKCRLLLIDDKISSARELVGMLEVAIKGNFPLLIMADDIEQEALATLVVNKLRGNLKVVAIKAPGFGERKTMYLEDISIMTGATLVKEELGVSLAKADSNVLGLASKVEIAKDHCILVGDGSYQDLVEARVTQIRNQLENTEQQYEKDKLNERIARLSGGVAIINVGAQTETELKERKLRVEDALCATRAAVEEGIVVGGGCTLIKLSREAQTFNTTLTNDEQKVGADILRKALLYPLRLIAYNAGANGSVVLQKVIDSADPNYGYNAATGEFQDLMKNGIIDPTKVIRCALANAGSVSKTFLTADCVVCGLVEEE